MNILIANPPWQVDGRKGVRAGSRWPHLKIPEEAGYMPYPFFMGYAGALLKDHGFKVKLIDALAEDMSYDDFYSAVQGGNFDLIVLEISTPSLRNDLEIVKKIRTFFSGKLTLVGTETSLESPRFLDEHPEIDYLLYGEYEQTLLEMCTCFQNEWALDKVTGCVFRKDGVSVRNGARKLDYDLNNYPWPERDQLPMHKYEDRPGGIPAPSVQMWGSRGCAYRCTFCVWPQMMYKDAGYRPRDAIKMADEFENCVRNRGFKSVYFDDDTFNIGKPRMLKFCDELIRRGLHTTPWAAMTRADLMDYELLKKMKKAGLVAVKYGVESASQKLLDSIQKNMKIEKTIQSIKLTKRLGIKVHLTFTFGLPGETKETIQNTVTLARELSPDSLQFSINTPFPGTKYYHELKEKNQIVSEDSDDYDGNTTSVIRTEHLSPEDLVEAQREAYRLWSLHKRNVARREHYGPLTLFLDCYREHGLAYTTAHSLDYVKKEFLGIKQKSKVWQEKAININPLYDYKEFNNQDEVLGRIGQKDRHSKLNITLSTYNFHSVDRMVAMVGKVVHQKLPPAKKFSVLPFTGLKKRYHDYVDDINLKLHKHKIELYIDEQLNDVLGRFEMAERQKQSLPGHLQTDLTHNLQIALGMVSRHMFVGPKVFHLDIANGCNMDCVFCWWHSPTIKDKYPAEWKKRRIDMKEFYTVIDDLMDLKIQYLLLSGPGDPLTHPQFFEIAEYLKKTNFHISLFTNGLLFNEKIMKQVVDSKFAEIHWNIGAASPRVFKLVHPKQSEEDFYRVKERINFITRQKKFTGKPKIVMVNVLTNLNYKEVVQMVEFAKEMHIEQIKMSVYQVEPENSHLMLTESQMEELKTLLRIAQLKAAEAGIWIDASIEIQMEKVDIGTGEWSQDYGKQSCFAGYNYSRYYLGEGVSFCCDKKLVAPTLEHGSFAEVWQGKKYQQYRDSAIAFTEEKNMKLLNGWNLIDDVCNRCGNYQGNNEMREILEYLGVKDLEAFTPEMSRKRLRGEKVVSGLSTAEDLIQVKV